MYTAKTQANTEKVCMSGNAHFPQPALSMCFQLLQPGLPQVKHPETQQGNLSRVSGEPSSAPALSP